MELRPRCPRPVEAGVQDGDQLGFAVLGGGFARA